MLQFLEHSFHVSCYFVVPETNNRKSLGIEKCGSTLIVCLSFEVLRTIELDDQSLIDAAKVDDIWPDWMLAPESEREELLSSKLTPQRIFCICLIAPKPPRLVALQTMPVSLVI